MIYKRTKKNIGFLSPQKYKPTPLGRRCNSGRHQRSNILFYKILNVIPEENIFYPFCFHFQLYRLRPNGNVTVRIHKLHLTAHQIWLAYEPLQVSSLLTKDDACASVITMLAFENVLIIQTTKNIFTYQCVHYWWVMPYQQLN